MDNDWVIQAFDLFKVYGSGEARVEALKGVSLNVKKGEFIAVMGPSGSGKSTLLHILGCLDQPTSGSYLLDGIDVSELSDNELAFIRNLKIGFVFQQFNLLGRATALENVLLPLIYYRGKKGESPQERAIKALKEVGLEGKIYARPNELSGGQQQKVAIARALINQPAIILADEPTGNLDSKSSQEIMAIFQKLNQKGKTIVLITHEPDIAAYAQRVIKMRDGLIESDQLNGKRQVILKPGGLKKGEESEFLQ